MSVTHQLVPESSETDERLTRSFSTSRIALACVGIASATAGCFALARAGSASTSSLVAPISLANTPADLRKLVNPPVGECDTASAMTLSSHRLQRLTHSDDILTLTRDKSETEQFTLKEAFTDAAGIKSYYIKVSKDSGDWWLSESGGQVDLTAREANKSPWTFLDAGAGQVYIRSGGSASGFFLEDVNGKVTTSPILQTRGQWQLKSTERTTPLPCNFAAAKLFCFVVMRHWGRDLALMKLHYKNTAGIYQHTGVGGAAEDYVCADDPAPQRNTNRLVFSGDTKKIGTATATVGLILQNEVEKTIKIEHPTLSFAEHASQNNHDLFKLVWENIEGLYHKYDWSVKVDPDTFFVPSRLALRVGGNMGKARPVFFANCWANIDVQQQGDRGNTHGGVFMYGAIEVFSKAAMDEYFEHSNRCRNIVFEAGGYWEERYFTHCMKAVGALLNPWLSGSLNLLSDPHCIPGLAAPDCTGNAVAMHPIDADSFETCQAHVTATQAVVR